MMVIIGREACNRQEKTVIGRRRAVATSYRMCVPVVKHMAERRREVVHQEHDPKNKGTVK